MVPRQRKRFCMLSAEQGQISIRKQIRREEMMFFKKKKPKIQKEPIFIQDHEKYDIEEINIPEENVLEVLEFVDNYKYNNEDYVFYHIMNKKLFELLPQLEEGYTFENKHHKKSYFDTIIDTIVYYNAYETDIWSLNVHDYARKISFLKYTKKEG